MRLSVGDSLKNSEEIHIMSSYILLHIKFLINILYSIRSSHKFVPTFVYTFHVSIYEHTAIRDQCT